jgi:hypothetical protein
MTDHAREARSTSGGTGIRMEHLDTAEVARWVDDCTEVMSNALTRRPSVAVSLAS